MLTCYEYNSCIYYSYSSDQCSLCIHDDDDLFTSGELQNGTEFTDNVYVKNDSNLAFRRLSCGTMHPTVAPEVRFNYTVGSITRIDVCLSTWMSAVYTGFALYSSGALVGSHGSCLYEVGVASSWLFDANEIILRVEYYFRIGVAPGYAGYVLTDVAMYTNKATYGPLHGGSGDVYTDSGYNLLGFVGWAGWATDNIGSNFERC